MRPIRTSYFLRIPNVGDRINPPVVTALTGVQTRFTNRLGQPHLLAVGSVMAGATLFSQIGGSGVMHRDGGTGAASGVNIHALRGALSYAALRRDGMALADMPLGDPGYLAPALLGVMRAAAPAFRIGIAAHYVDRSHPIVQRMMREDGVVDLDVHDAPEVFLRRMATCQVVLSTSLHGLVFAEALGIANLWLRAGDEIGGGDFKFQDWFTTTRKPQGHAHRLVAGDTADELAGRARLHESMIDAVALTAAFPHHRLELLRDDRIVVSPVQDGRARPTPVFLISFNRGAMLMQTIAAIRRLSRPTEIVVHDNGSTDPATLIILDRLEAEGIRVVRRAGIAVADELNRVDETVQAFFASWAEPGRYVVSDCDVDMSVADPRALDVYDWLLNRFRHVACVGPMLRIADISPRYPLYNQVMNRHIEQFWSKQPTIVQSPWGEAAFQPAPIDTTFALHRAGEAFHRLKPALRVYEPFEARHLDWYGTGADSVYAESSSAAIAHWDNRAQRDAYRSVECEHAVYCAVRVAPRGRLETLSGVRAARGRSRSGYALRRRVPFRPRHSHRRHRSAPCGRDKRCRAIG